ncbi:DUF4253 domain-containing protein [Haliangium sp.]|uniref:DUF4253 domain-containing protein n=1 Tax=Haliangium sp. TaxID=2663208 RepID=UPI003D10D501
MDVLAQLARAGLGQRTATTLTAPNGDVVVAVEVGPGDVVEVWQTARQVGAHTSTYPVVTCCWSQAGTWEDALRAEDLFSRWSYEQEPLVAGSPEDATPSALIAASRAVDIPQFLERCAAERGEEGLDECVELELELTASRFGEAPSHSFGAEIVAHYGTMLQLIVSRRPDDIDDAWALAYAQQLVAECTTVLPGISLRDHARALMHADRWFLHQRP